MKIILAQPRGFCAGVDRAIDIVKEALKIYGPPVYVRHEIVHNKRVVEDLKEKGAVFVEEIKEIIGADTLGYLSMEGTLNSTDLNNDNFCTACFSGEYPIKIKGENGKAVLKG